MREKKFITLNSFPHGLNTASPAFQLAPTEMSRCVNFKINKRGLQTRPAMKVYTGTAIGIPKSGADVVIGSTIYQFVSDDDYKIYYLVGTTPTEIATAEGEIQIVAYNGVAVILDGSYIKYIDEDLELKIAYDDGTGTTGYQFDNSSEDNEDALTLGDGTNTAIAQLFTTQAWTSGYTIPPTTVTAYLSHTGEPTGSINAVIREADTDNLDVQGTAIATVEFMADISELTDVATEYSATFTEDDITTEMSPDTNYYLSLEKVNSASQNVTDITKANPGVVRCVNHGYSVGGIITFSELHEMTELNDTSQTITAVDDEDHFSINDTSGYGSAEQIGGLCVQSEESTNCVNVYYAKDIFGDGKMYHYDGWWNANTNKDALMSLRPGMPPKAEFGVVSDHRLFVAGDPDHPGYVWYGNLSHLDWSTSDGGGYVGANDDDANSFNVGGLAVLYRNLYVYGKESQPYLSQLTGSSPNDYIISQSYQHAWTLPKTIKNAVNDIWIANKDGVDTLSGVEEYGDIRTFRYSDPIEDRIIDYWSDNAIAGYYPRDGQFWLYMPGYHRIQVFHTKHPIPEINENGIRYPSTEYEFCIGHYSSSTYKWTASSNGDSEYYCELAAGGDPSIDNEPDYVTLDGKKITNGAIGSLSDHQWDYGDNDSLGYNTIYIRDESGDPDTTEAEIRGILVPTCFCEINNTFMWGASDGYFYYLDEDEYKDVTTERINFDIASPFIMFPLGHANIEKYYGNLCAKGGATADISFYRDEFQNSAQYSFSKIIVPDDRLTVNDLTMDVADAVFPIDTTVTRQENPLWNYININTRSVQIRINNIILAGYPLYINEQVIRYRDLSY